MGKIEDVYPKWLINIVFIHELGHYIAGLINYKHTDLGKPKTISLYPCEQVNRELCGHVVVEKPIDYNNEIVPKERLAEYIGRVIMGCIFQSYYLKSNLDVCLSSTGKFDSGHIFDAKNHYLEYDQMRKLSTLEDNFLEMLKQNQILEFLFSIKPTDFIQNTETENQWMVDLGKLDDFLKNVDLKPFETEYSAFLERLRKVIFSQ